MSQLCSCESQRVKTEGLTSLNENIMVMEENNNQCRGLSKGGFSGILQPMLH